MNVEVLSYEPSLKRGKILDITSNSAWVFRLHQWDFSICRSLEIVCVGWNPPLSQKEQTCIRNNLSPYIRNKFDLDFVFILSYWGNDNFYKTTRADTLFIESP